MIGSGFVGAADSPAAAKALNRSDPFAKAGLRRIISIRAFNKRGDDRA